MWPWPEAPVAPHGENWPRRPYSPSAAHETADEPTQGYLTAAVPSSLVAGAADQSVPTLFRLFRGQLALPTSPCYDPLEYLDALSAQILSVQHAVAVGAYRDQVREPRLQNPPDM